MFIRGAETSVEECGLPCARLDCEAVITTGATAVLYLEGWCYLAVRVSETRANAWVTCLVAYVSLLFTRTREAFALGLS